MIRYIFSKDYFVPLRMRVTHPIPQIVTAKIRHPDNFDIGLRVSPQVKLRVSFWKGPVSLGRLKGPPSPCHQESCGNNAGQIAGHWLRALMDGSCGLNFPRERLLACTCASHILFAYGYTRPTFPQHPPTYTVQTHQQRPSDQRWTAKLSHLKPLLRLCRTLNFFAIFIVIN